jgi:hypothetical protein
MNAAQAKQLSLPDLLARLGHQPVKSQKEGNELWYTSPFRAEAEASFHTSFLGGKWIWKDFGDIGGTVVDFAMRYHNVSSVRDALAWLDTLFQQLPSAGKLVAAQSASEQPSLFSFQQQRGAAAPVAEDSRQLEFLAAQTISHPVILEYLVEERHIPQDLALRFLKQVSYRNTATGKEYFGFGMENMSGGYEVRVASSKYDFKSALKARDITLIQGSSPERGAANVFEGMLDFLSLLVLLGTKSLAGDAIIMHSLSSFQRAADFIRGKGYGRVNTFLDNDRAGQECTQRFISEFGVVVTSQSEYFANYNDLNDALRANTPAL